MTVDAATVQQLVHRLPTRRRWMLQETPLDYDFSAGVRGPKPLAQKSYEFTLEPEWLQLLIFGEYDYAEGGGAHPFLGVRRTDGAVYGLDFERDEPLFLLNSALEAFARTFERIDMHLGEGRPLPRDVGETLKAIDPEVYDDADWKRFIEFVLSDQEE
jgi:hypothetical protein